MKIYITGEDIKVGQLLKVGQFISTGGAAKWFLENNQVVYKDKRIETRGTKITAGSTIWINDEVYQVVAKDA